MVKTGNTISIAMCTYNGARYLEEQLASIAAQTRPPDELVVCDDRSQDVTTKIIESFSSTSPFPVRLQINEQTLGSTKNFEKAISLCNGDVIVLSDQDDVWREDKLALIQKCFSENPSVGLAFSDAEVVDKGLQSLGKLWDVSGFDSRKRQAIREGRAFEVLLPAWWVTGATMAFRSKFKKLVLPIPDDLSMIHDGWISLVIAAVSEVTFIEEPLILYRQHDLQQMGAPTWLYEARQQAGNQPESIAEAMRRPNSHESLLQNVTAVHQRLRNAGTASDHQIARIEDLLKHLQTRSNLPTRAGARFSLVLRELISMRYHKYSNGLSSAAKDLLSTAQQETLN